MKFGLVGGGLLWNKKEIARYWNISGMGINEDIK
jgi:hypothetical protein